MAYRRAMGDENAVRTILKVTARIAALGAMTAIAACGTPEDTSSGSEPFASRYVPLPSEATLLSGATVLIGTGERLENADVLMRDGKITAVGEDLDAGDAEIVDASGRWVTPASSTFTRIWVSIRHPERHRTQTATRQRHRSPRTFGPSTASGHTIQVSSRRLLAV